MHCAEFDLLVHDLGRADMVSAEAREAALVHAESCARCALFLIEIESLEFNLRLLASETANQQALARIEKILADEFRRKKVSASQVKAGRQFTVLATAAAVLLVLGLTVLRYDSISKAPAERAGVTTSTTPQTSPAAMPAKSQGAPKSLSPGTTASNDSLEPADPDSAQPFMQLPYADDPATLEGSAIVRVTLPRSALASFGFPTSGLADADSIPADMVVSEDGTPQAIRLVSQANAKQTF
jgi:hypothetical protein